MGLAEMNKCLSIVCLWFSAATSPWTKYRKKKKDFYSSINQHLSRLSDPNAVDIHLLFLLLYP
jgi:hypothetical protein